MYSIDWALLLSRTPGRSASATAIPQGQESAATPTRHPIGAISGVVWSLGITSLLTDISSEMVASVLPLYLVLHLGMSPLAFGVVDGLQQGAASLVRVLSGMLADRWRRYKDIAVAGYAISAVCRALLLFAGGAWSAITAIVAADRIGKGIRTAPRDALISNNTPRALLGTAFGIHRALDATGAMLGPVAAFLILALVPRGFDLLFMVSFAVAIVGVGAIAVFVPRGDFRHSSDGTRDPALSSVSEAVVGPEVRGLIVSGSVLALATVSDAFIYLLVQRRLAAPILAFPLFFVGTSLFTALFSLPCGRLADWVGRRLVLLTGYALLAGVYVALIVPSVVPSPIVALTVVALLGAHYAATDGVLTAMAAARLTASRTATGLSILATSTNLSRFVGSIVFGWAWTIGGSTVSVAAYLALLAIATLVASRALPQEPDNAPGD